MRILKKIVRNSTHIIISDLSTVCSTASSSALPGKHQRFTLLVLCEGLLLVTGDSIKQRASNAEIGFMSWHRHVIEAPMEIWLAMADRTFKQLHYHYSDVIMSEMASQITSVLIVYLTVCSVPDQRKHQSSASLAFVRGIYPWPVNSLHKGSVRRKIIPFDDVVMQTY